MKIFGAIEFWKVRLEYRLDTYRLDTVFNAEDYLLFLEQRAERYRRQGAILIAIERLLSQRQASVELVQLQPAPAGSRSIASPLLPEFNPAERLWQPTQKNGTHHCFISGVDALFAALGPKVQARQRTIIDLNSKDSGAEERPEGDTWRV